MKKITYLLLFVAIMVLMYGCGSSEVNDIEDKIEALEDSYTIDDFPYYYKSESKELIKFYNKVLKGDYKKYCYLEEDDGYKATIEKTAYLYVGEMKNNRPHGKGVIFELTGQVYKDEVVLCHTIYILGNFEKGKLNGYSLTFCDNYYPALVLDYEGEFSNGERSGRGVEYITELEMYFGYANDEITILDIYDTKVCTDLVIQTEGIAYVGGYEKGLPHGEGYLFNDDELIYKGSFENGDYEGEGILYFSDGTIKYDGEFKNGKYHGKGTLYDEDGDVKYKGKFKNGDYE